MKYFEFGTDKQKLMVLLHGGLAGEHPQQFLEEVTKAHQKAKG